MASAEEFKFCNHKFGAGPTPHWGMRYTRINQAVEAGYDFKTNGFYSTDRAINDNGRQFDFSLRPQAKPAHCGRNGCNRSDRTTIPRVSALRRCRQALIRCGANPAHNVRRRVEAHEGSSQRGGMSFVTSSFLPFSSLEFSPTSARRQAEPRGFLFSFAAVQAAANRAGRRVISKTPVRAALKFFSPARAAAVSGLSGGPARPLKAPARYPLAIVQRGGCYGI
jgi:hypothetical protein